MKVLLIFFLLVLVSTAFAAKPNVWVYTDMSDPRDQRAGGHPFNDPDDIVTMAALLLEANQFLNGSYYIHAPYDFSYQIFDEQNQVVRTDSLEAGKYLLDLSALDQGDYKVQVCCGGIIQYFNLNKKLLSFLITHQTVIGLI